MKYWILRLDWSQTEHEYVIVHAKTQALAESRYTYVNGPRYVTCYGSTDKIVNL